MPAMRSPAVGLSVERPLSELVERAFKPLTFFAFKANFFFLFLLTFADWFAD